jgi:hypothetical protein
MEGDVVVEVCVVCGVITPHSIPYADTRMNVTNDIRTNIKTYYVTILSMLPINYNICIFSTKHFRKRKYTQRNGVYCVF